MEELEVGNVQESDVEVLQLTLETCKLTISMAVS
jgi:hypothetical protein